MTLGYLFRTLQKWFESLSTPAHKLQVFVCAPARTRNLQFQYRLSIFLFVNSRNIRQPLRALHTNYAYSFVRLPGLEPRITDPKSVVISISLQARKWQHNTLVSLKSNLKIAFCPTWSIILRRAWIHAAMVKWYNGSLPRISRGFDYPWPHSKSPERRILCGQGASKLLCLRVIETAGTMWVYEQVRRDPRHLWTSVN